MAPRVCPWWIGWLLASPVRKLMQDPARILAPWVRDGMTVLEPGPGMGFFTLELARRVGPGTTPRFSPDGHAVAYVSTESGADEVFARVVGGPPLPRN